MSQRSGGPFIAVNCAAFAGESHRKRVIWARKGSIHRSRRASRGCFEQAHNGTVFLDEIADMPIGTQAKLLRVLEESTVRRLGGKSELAISVRVIAATNRGAEQAILDNHLREDLFYRLSVFHITLPPLRERKEDIPALCDAIILNLNRKHECRITGLDTEVLERFQRLAWPGNVRQLRNLLERAVIIAGEGQIRSIHLPPELQRCPPLNPRVTTRSRETKTQSRCGSVPKSRKSRMPISTWFLNTRRTIEPALRRF